MTPLTESVARAQGYRPLTVPYRLPAEQWLLDGVLADMRRGEIDHVTVAKAWTETSNDSVYRREGLEVWRR